MTGELTAHRVVGDDFFSIAKVRTTDGPATLVGKLLGASIGDTIRVNGMWSTHKSYGPQFRVRDCVVLMPNTDNGVIAWMAGRLKHLGKARASEMLLHFGGAGAVWDAIENTPARLCEVSGITPKRADEIVDAYARFVHDRDRMIQFKRWGLTDHQISKVVAKWGDESEMRMRKNPYELARYVDGFGFIKADAVAQRMGVPLDAPPRIRCGLMHTMEQAAGHGHVYVPSGKLVKMAADSTLRIDSALVAKELKIMRKSGELVQRGKHTFTRALNAFEQVCADRIIALLGQRVAVKGR